MTDAASSDRKHPPPSDPSRPPDAAALPRLVIAPQIGELTHCHSSAQMRVGLARLAHALGFDWAIAAIEDWRGFGSPIRHMVSSLPESWHELYVSQALYRRSPIVRHCRESTEPLVWVARRLHDQAPDFWPLATRYGLCEGLSLSSHRPQSLAMLTLARGEGPFSATGTPPPIPSEYQMLPRLAHDCLLEIVRQEHMKSAEHSFSEREIECLHWSARGKTSAETALLLHLSEATVNFHLQRVMAKLQASNRQQAVAIATAMGLFNPAIQRFGRSD